MAREVLSGSQDGLARWWQLAGARRQALSFFWVEQGQNDHCPIQLFHPSRPTRTVFATCYAPLASGRAHHDGISRFGPLAGLIAERIERRATTEGRLGASAFTTDAACAALLSLGFAIC